MVSGGVGDENSASNAPPLAPPSDKNSIQEPFKVEGFSQIPEMASKRLETQECTELECKIYAPYLKAYRKNEEAGLLPEDFLRLRIAYDELFPRIVESTEMAAHNKWEYSKRLAANPDIDMPKMKALQIMCTAEKAIHEAELARKAYMDAKKLWDQVRELNISLIEEAEVLEGAGIKAVAVKERSAVPGNTPKFGLFEALPKDALGALPSQKEARKMGMPESIARHCHAAKMLLKRGELSPWLLSAMETFIVHEIASIEKAQPGHERGLRKGAMNKFLEKWRSTTGFKEWEAHRVYMEENNGIVYQQPGAPQKVPEEFRGLSPTKAFEASGKRLQKVP